MQDNLKKYKKGFTHGGFMHADEVFAAAFLRLINPDFKIVRQKNRNEAVPTSKDILIFDIGLGKYDHHQKDSEYRENGIKYASLGLIVKYFGKDLGLTQKEIEYLDFNMIEKMDISDNEGKLNDYATMIDRFNPSWNEQNVSSDLLFERAVNFAKTILEKEIYCLKNNKYQNQNISKIERLYMDSFLGLIDESYDYKRCGCNSLIEAFEKYGMRLLNENEFKNMSDKIKRYQTLFDKRNYKAGFIRMVNNYDLSVISERNEIMEIIKDILRRDLKRSKSDVLGIEIVEKLYSEAIENYLILPGAGLPWSKIVTTLNGSSESKDIDYIVFKSSGGDYGIQAVSKKYSNKKDLRKPFPEEWRGESSENLDKIVKGFKFCHLSGFYCAVETLDGAINILNIINKKTGF